MSNNNGASSGSSNVRERVRVVGVPKRCWCGELVVAKISKSDPNPCRRYFRCGFAASQKVDEALLDEVKTLASENERLKEDIKELMKETTKQQKVVFDMVEDALAEAKLEFKSKMQKMVIVGVGICLVMSGIVWWCR